MVVELGENIAGVVGQVNADGEIGGEGLKSAPSESEVEAGGSAGELSAQKFQVIAEACALDVFDAVGKDVLDFSGGDLSNGNRLIESKADGDESGEEQDCGDCDR